MAGVVPFAGCTPGRKQWNIRDKRTVRRLRSQLAEDGCPESQLALAKQLLEEKSNTNNDVNEENARLGVFWLMQASDQGCQEATEMLQRCLDSAEGITEHNYLDVKACLNTSLNEKLARRAAREMFLSLSSGQDFITTEQLRRQMRKIENGRREIGESSANAEQLCSREWRNHRGDHWGEKLTEDHLEEAASTYSRGELPLVQRVLTLTDPLHRELSELPYLHRAVRHPFLSLQYTYSSLLDMAWNFVCPRSAMLLLILLLTPLENFLMAFPLVLFHGSFLVMVISTLHMLQTKREFSRFRVWSQLFLSYDREGHLNTEDPEYDYIKKNLRPYGIFFLSLLIHLSIYPLVSEMWMPQSELAVLSFALTFTTLLHFLVGFDFLMLLSFGLHVLAKYPYEQDGVVRQTWRFLDNLPAFASQVVGSGVEFCLNFRGVFYLLIPGLFVKMASRESWRGTYKVLIPHCVTLAWWQIAVLSCQGATLYGLIRSTLALVGMVLFLPIVSLATLALPVVAVLSRITEPGITTVTMTTTLLASALLLLGIYLSSPRFQCLGKIQMVLAAAAAAILLVPTFNEQIVKPMMATEMPIESLTWDQYVRVCPNVETIANTHVITAQSQTQCLHLAGLPVNWEGTVDDVSITAVHNTLAMVVSYLPDRIKSYVTCFYGMECDGSRPELQEVCDVMRQVKRHSQLCHLAEYDRYDMEIRLTLVHKQWFAGTSPTLTVYVDNSLRNITLQLKPKDRIWFSGTLSQKPSKSPTVFVTAEEIGCVACENKDLTSAKLESRQEMFFELTKKAIHRVLNFVLNPVVIFR